VGMGCTRRWPDRLVARALAAGARRKPGGKPMSVADLLDLFVRFLMLSLLSVGGAISTAPEMHRFLVLEHGWLDDAGFSTSIAIAQAAPGPNLLFVAVLGYQVAGLIGAAVTLIGMLLPSAITTVAISR